MEEATQALDVLSACLPRGQRLGEWSSENCGTVLELWSDSTFVIEKNGSRITVACLYFSKALF